MAKKQKTQREKTISTVINIVIFVVCIVAAYFLATFLFVTVPVSGISMEPTLHDGDTVLVYKPGKYQFGDVVIFETDIPDSENGSGNNKHFVKRIIGLPGDLIEFKHTSSGYRVFRNGEVLEDKYVNQEIYVSGNNAVGKVTVPKDEFFYLGDNRNHSSDSSTTKETAPLKSIVGRVVLRYRGKTILSNPSTVKRIKNVIGLEEFSPEPVLPII